MKQFIRLGLLSSLLITSLCSANSATYYVEDTLNSGNAPVDLFSMNPLPPTPIDDVGFGTGNLLTGLTDKSVFEGVYRNNDSSWGVIKSGVTSFDGNIGRPFTVNKNINTYYKLNKNPAENNERIGVGIKDGNPLLYIYFSNSVDKTNTIKQDKFYGNGEVIGISFNETNTDYEFIFNMKKGIPLSIESSELLDIYNAITDTDGLVKILVSKSNKYKIRVIGLKQASIMSYTFGNTKETHTSYIGTGIVYPNGGELSIDGTLGEIKNNGVLLSIDPKDLYKEKMILERINPFIDINDSFAKEYILNLSDKKIINGYDDKTFKPENPVTRAEFLKMIMNKNKIDTSSTGSSSQSGTISSTLSKFSDTSGWIVQYAEKAKELGFIQSSDKFNPNNKITRVEAIKILLNVSKRTIKEYTTSTYKDVDGWKVNYIETAKDLGIINSSDYFRPNDNISRAESSKIIDLLN